MINILGNAFIPLGVRVGTPGSAVNWGGLRLFWDIRV